MSTNNNRDGRISRFVRRLPFISGLPDTSLYDNKSALSKTITTILISTFPVWLGALFVCLFRPEVNYSNLQIFISEYINSFLAIINDGVLGIYAATMLAPVYLKGMKNLHTGAKPFPSATALFMSGLIILILSAFLIANDEVDLNLNISLMFPISILMFCMTAVIMFLATAYQLSITTLSDSHYNHSNTISNDAQGFADELNQMMGASTDE